ncbi:hypothetical protein B0H10DRAFT_521068 [Mycena sp. CBHHK59/15]|nr:hypothetical protein B0H10DRAFT_521068 [Mycena sp. CBHHK59/15]
MTLEIFEQCLNLRTCTLHIPFVPIDQPNSIPLRGFTMPRLSAFSVRATNFPAADRTLTDIFNNLTLPSLRSLDIEDCNGDLSIFPALERLFSQSPCRLQKLSVTDITATADDLIRLLGFPPVSSLAELVIHDRGRDWRDDGGCMLSDAFLRAMTPTPGKPALCPSLAVVKFTQCIDFSDEMLLNFLHSRSRPQERVASLEFVEIVLDHAIEFDLDAALRQWAEHGLKVVIRHEYDPWIEVRVSPWEGLTT